MTVKRILVIAPHPDDETLGLGGTMAKLASQGHEVNVLVVSGHLPPLYKREDYERTVNEANQAFKILGVSNSIFLELPPTTVSFVPVREINDKIFQVVKKVRPSIVFCPYPDRHIDHRTVFDAVMVATRPVGLVGRDIANAQL